MIQDRAIVTMEGE